jgi:hypothetical protein
MFFHKFRAAYAQNVPALLEKYKWTIVDPGFKVGQEKIG